MSAASFLENSQCEERMENPKDHVEFELQLKLQALSFSALEENRKIVFGELLRKILNGLNCKDLLESGRLVSKRWSDESTFILKRRIHSFRTTFKFDVGKNAFISFKSKTQNGGDPKEGNVDENQVLKLTEVLSSCPSHNFPTVHFHFEGGSLDCPQVLEFFSLYGKSIKKLTADVRKNPPTIDGALRQKIFPLVPNLEFLEFMDSESSSVIPPVLADVATGSGQVQGQIQGQIQGQGQLLYLKCLKFGASLGLFNRIPILLKLIKPELPQACSVVISTLKLFACVPQGYDESLDFQIDSTLVKSGAIHEIQNLNLMLYEPDERVIPLLDQLAECHLAFKQINVTSILRNSHPIRYPSTDLKMKGRALCSILCNSRDTLKNANFSIQTFLLLTRQPFPAHFLPKLETMTLKFTHGLQVTSPRTFAHPNRWNFKVADYLPRSEPDSYSFWNGDPPLWKNLSEIMPSLKCLVLDLFDGDCEPWMPFFDAGAGQNLTVKKLLLHNLYSRAILQKIGSRFPALTFLRISVCFVPPPSVVDSWQNLIRWLWLWLGADQEEEKMNSLGEMVLVPGLEMKLVEKLTLEFKSCGGTKKGKGKNFSFCSLSKIKGGKLLLIQEDRNSWREISEADQERNFKYLAPSDCSKSRVNKIQLEIVCKEHDK